MWSITSVYYDGDVTEISFNPFGRPLRNPLNTLEHEDAPVDSVHLISRQGCLLGVTEHLGFRLAPAQQSKHHHALNVVPT
jgi:hypothetical protein